MENTMLLHNFMETEQETITKDFEILNETHNLNDDICLSSNENFDLQHTATEETGNESTALNENLNIQDPTQEKDCSNISTNSNIESTVFSDTKGRSERDLDKRVMDILLTIGISANLHGYGFLKDSIKLAMANPIFMGSVTKNMYPAVATKHKTTAFRVERAMRHAIDVSYNKGKIICLNKIFELEIFSPYDKPTNAEFIALIADKLAQEFYY